MTLIKWPSVTVVTPTIPPRSFMLGRAVASVAEQDYAGRLVHTIERDHDHRGATLTRWDALRQVSTEYVAFLDDDDEFYPHHLSTIIQAMHDQKADYGYSWFDVIGGDDPFPAVHETTQWTNKVPINTTMVVVVKTPLAQLAYERVVKKNNAASPRPVFIVENGGGQGYQPWHDLMYEDWHFVLNCVAVGAKIWHVLGQRTWAWHHHGSNTSGRPDQWS